MQAVPQALGLYFAAGGRDLLVVRAGSIDIGSLPACIQTR